MDGSISPREPPAFASYCGRTDCRGESKRVCGGLGCECFAVMSVFPGIGRSGLSEDEWGDRGDDVNG